MGLKEGDGPEKEERGFGRCRMTLKVLEVDAGPNKSRVCARSHARTLALTF